jgi:hypothetical protein
MGGGGQHSQSSGLPVTMSLAVRQRHRGPSQSRAAWLFGLCLATSTIAAMAVTFVAAVHLDDRYAVDHASGARIALARYADHGMLYPPLVGNESFGGTRFMPLPALLHVAMSRMTHEYVLSGKLLAAAAMLAVCLVMFEVLRRNDCPVPLALGLIGVVLTTQTGLLAATGLRADSLPLLLQLLAVAVVTSRSSRSRREMWVSAALAALAVTAKLHALWAPAAIVIWLWRSDRQRLRDFVAAYIGITAVLLGTLTVVTERRFPENVFGLSMAGVTGPVRILTSPYRLLHLLVAEAPATWFLLPLALLVVAMAARRRSIGPWELSLVAALLVTLVVLSDIGTGGNQLLDTTVVSAIVVGCAAGRVSEIGSIALWRRALGGTLVWLTITGMAVTVAPAVQDAVSTMRDSSRYHVKPLAGVADERTVLLSEDPYVPVSLEQDPVVLDPFMLPRIAKADPAAVSALVTRIDTQDFDLVVLVERPSNSDWWADYHFGPEVIAAVQRSYALSERVQGYDIYRPRQQD